MSFVWNLILNVWLVIETGGKWLGIMILSLFD